MEKLQELIKENYADGGSKRFNRFISDVTDDYFKLRFLLFYNDLKHAGDGAIKLREGLTFQKYLKADETELLEIIRTSMQDNEIHSSVWLRDAVFYTVDTPMLELSNYRKILTKVLDKSFNSNGETEATPANLLETLKIFHTVIFDGELITGYDEDSFNEFLESMIPSGLTLKFVSNRYTDNDGSAVVEYETYEDDDIFKYLGENFIKFAMEVVGDDNAIDSHRNFGDIHPRNIVRNDFLIYKAMAHDLAPETIVELSYQLFNARPGLYRISQLESFINNYDGFIPIGLQVELI